MTIETTKTTKEIVLDNTGLTAKIRIVTELEEPASGDGVRAVWDIQMPGGVELAPQVRFEGRVSVCGETLNSAWGTYVDGTRTSDDSIAYGSTHVEATAKAMELAETALGCLLVALVRRAAAHAKIIE
jgi:hypothetical protein